MAEIAYASSYANQSGSTWANQSSAYGDTTSTYCTWTSTTRNATGSIDFGGFGTWSAIPAGSTINSVVVSIKGYVNNTTYISALTARAFVGATGQGSAATTLTRSTLSSNIYANISYTDITLSELQGNTLAIRVTTTHNNSTSSGVAYWDYFKVTVDYSTSATVTATLVTGSTAVPSPTFIGSPDASISPTTVAAAATLPGERATPESIATLAARWKAADLSAVGDGNDVTDWVDSVAGITATQATTSRKPTYVASVAGLNSKPALDFDKSTNQNLTAPNGGTGVAALLRGTSQPYTVFVAGRVGTLTSDWFNGILHLHRSQYAEARLRFLLNSNGESSSQTYITADCETASLESATLLSLSNTNYVQTVTYNGASQAYLYRDGSEISSSSSWANGSSDTYKINIGTTNDGDAQWAYDGHIAEILVYSTSLTAAQRAAVHSYLQDEYGITTSDYVPGGPSFAASSTVIATVVAGTASIPTPTVGAEDPNADITATTVAGVGTVPAPTVSASSEVVVKRWGNLLTLAAQDGDDADEITTLNGSLTYETAAPLTGTSSFKVTGNGAGDGVRFVVYPSGYRKACVGGERVTASVTVKNLGASKDFTFYVETFTAANGYLYSHTVGGAIPFGAGATATWTGTITTHASAELMGLLVISAPSTDAFLVDDIYFSRPAASIPTPTVTAEGGDDANVIATTVIGAAGVGTPNTPIKPPTVAANLITNAGAEVDTSGWASNDGATITRDTGESHSGVASFKIVAGTGDFAGIQAGTPYVRITPGVTYTLSAWVKGSGAGTWLLWTHLLNYDTSLRRQAGSSGITVTSTWTRYSITFTAEPGEVLLNPIFMLDGTASNGATVYVDDWLLESYTPTPITNGSVENTPITDVYQYAGSNSAITQSSTYARSGTYSLRGNITGTNQTLLMEAMKPANAYTVTPGNPYTFSYWIRSNVARGSTAYINWYNASDGWIDDSWGSGRTTTVGDWTLITVTATAPTSAAKAMYCGVRVDAVANSTEYHYADDFAFFEVTPRATTQTTIPTPTVVGSVDATAQPATVQATAMFGAAASPWVVTGRYQVVYGTGQQTMTTSSFTPTANSLLVVVWGCETSGNDINPALDETTISDSAGLTWTRRATSGILDNGDSWQGGGSVFTAPVGANPSSMTITIDPHPGSTAQAHMGMAVVDVTGHDPDAPFPQTWAVATNKWGGGTDTGSLSPTLGSAPTLGNLLLLIAWAENDASQVFTGPASGWTQVYNNAGVNSHTGVWYRHDSTATSATVSDLGEDVYYAGVFLGEFANKVTSGYPTVTTGSTATPATVAGTTRIFDAQSPTVHVEDFEYASSGNITTSNSIFDAVGGTTVYAPAPTGRTGNVGALSNATVARLVVGNGAAGWPITSGYIKLGAWVYFEDAPGTYEGILGAEDWQGTYIRNGWQTWGTGTAVRLVGYSGTSGSDYAISLDTWYYFDVEVDFATRQVIGHIYNASGTLLTTQTAPWIDVARTNTWGQADAIVLRRNSAGTTYFDDFSWSTASRPYATVTSANPNADITATTVAGAAAVASPGLATQPQPATVAAVAAVAAPGLATRPQATTVAAVATVGAPGLATRPQAVTVAAVAAVPAPGLATRPQAVTVAAIATVGTPGLATRPQAITVTATATIPVPTSISVGSTISVTTVIGVATTPAPTSISVGSTISAVIISSVATTPAPGLATQPQPVTVVATAAITGHTPAASSTVVAVIVTSVATVPTPGLATQPQSATVIATAAIPTPTVEAETTQNADITAVTVEAVAAIPTATPSTGSTVAATEISGVSAVPTVAPSTGSTIAAIVVSAVAAIPAPGLATRPQPATVATSATVPAPGLATRPQPIVVTAIVAVYGVTPKTGATVTAVVVAGVGTVPAATPSAGINIAAVEVAGSTQVGSIQFSSSVDVQAELISVDSNISVVQPTSSVSIVAVEVAGVSTITTPTFSMGATVEVVLVNAIAAVPQPTIQTQGNANIGANTVIGIASVGPATVSVGSTVTASLISCYANVLAPAPSAGSTVIATTVIGTSSVLDIAVSVGATLAAAVVECITSVPQVSYYATAVGATVPAVVVVDSPSVSTGSTIVSVTVVGVCIISAPGLATQPQLQEIVGFVSIYSVNVSVGVDLMAITVLAEAILPAPSVSAAGNVNITATTVTGITTIDRPTIPIFVATVSAVVLVGVVVIPQVAAIVAGLSVIPPPSVSTGSTVTPVTVAGVAATGSPGIGIGITAEVVQAISAVSAPTLSTGQTISATTVNTVGAVGSITLSAGSTITTATVVATAFVGSTTIAFGTTVSASAVLTVSNVYVPSVSAGNDIVISPSIVLTTSSITGHVVSISYNIPVATVVATSTVYAVTISFGAGVIATTIPATSQFGITTVHASSSVIAQTVLSIASVSEATTSASSRATPNVILVLTAIPVPYVESGSILTLTDDGSVGVVETVDILVLIQVVDSGSLSVSDLALVYPIAAGAVVTTNADDLVLITESNNDLDIYASSTGGENVILHSQAVGTVISSESSTTVFETDS